LDERIIQWRVGVVVICAALIGGIMIVFLFGEGWKRQYTLYLETPTAPGVTKNTPIRKNGILIGRVSDVETLDNGVLLTLRIARQERLYANEVAKIGTASFLGDAVIDIVPGAAPDRGALLVHQDYLRNVMVQRDPLEVVNMVMNMETKVSDALDAVRRAGDNVDQAAQGVRRLTDSVQQAFDEEGVDLGQLMADFRRLSNKGEAALDNFNQMMTNINDVIGDPAVRESLRTTASESPQLMADLRVAVNEASAAFAQLEAVATRFDSTLTDIDPLIESLGTEGPEILERLRASSQDLDALMSNAEEFTRGLNQGDGIIQRLVHDPNMSRDLAQTLANLRDITTRLRPVVNDVRVLADGLARDPGQLGIRGALDRRPANSGYKPTLTNDGDDW
jgi:phospholipid/cholesterol/gamma-HCH transport system substrate-binding protein